MHWSMLFIQERLANVPKQYVTVLKSLFTFSTIPVDRPVFMFTRSTVIGIDLHTIILWLKRTQKTTRAKL